MSAASTVQRPFPWIAIPRFPQPGQPYAFANRQEEVGRLYKAVVAAGNAVRPGQPGARYRGVISGYKGVGKSSVILQVLGMIRDPLGVVDGQVLTVPPDFPEPAGRERWLILSASGKLQSALTTFSLMIEFVRAWQGSRLKETVERASQSDVSREINTYLEGQLKSKGVRPESAEGQAAMKLSAGYIGKWTSMAKASATLEREVVISADLVTDALNAFFDTTDRAGIPTILVLDDFDEFASNVGPSHAERSRVLAGVLGTFNQLRPTSLLIGVREEYMHEDVFRQFDVHHVPPMTRASAALALDAWARVQQPPLTPEASAALQAFGDRFLARFDADAPVVIPFRFLQMVAWIGNNALERSGSDGDRILSYLRSTHNGETFRAIRRLADAMPDEDIPLCAEAVPLDPEPYTISPRDYRALISGGLLRPAMAGDDEDRRIVIDPLVAYLRAASSGAPAPPPA